MLGKLSDMFGPKGPNDVKPRRSRVNLDRRFTLLLQTAQGSMSSVHRALDNQNGRTVCLKVQNADKNAAAVARASRDEARPGEGEIALKVVHPNVARTFEIGDSTRGEHFLVMEYIDGHSFQFVRETHEADVARKIDLLTQAAEGLAAVHAAGFIHHDINPRNFLVNREGDVKLIDFGLAVPNTPAFRRPGNRTGTLQYLAPEVIRREPKDERLDIFAFGAMAFEFLTDKLPYDAGQNNSMAMILQRINTDPLDPAVANPRLHPALCAVVRKAIARRKEDRYATMTALLHDLRALPPEARGEPATPGSVEVSDDGLAPTKYPGGVFMLKAGALYMVRKTSQFHRRLQQMKQLSEKVEVIHFIPAADPLQAQTFWHDRFRAQRRKEDWFALSDQDVADFRSCPEMPPDVPMP